MPRAPPHISVAFTSKPLGLRLAARSTAGVVVESVAPASAAAGAGVQPGWILARIGDADVSALGVAEVQSRLAALVAGISAAAPVRVDFLTSGSADGDAGHDVDGVDDGDGREEEEEEGEEEWVADEAGYGGRYGEGGDDGDAGDGSPAVDDEDVDGGSDEPPPRSAPRFASSMPSAPVPAMPPTSAGVFGGSFATTAASPFGAAKPAAAAFAAFRFGALPASGAAPFGNVGSTAGVFGAAKK